MLKVSIKHNGKPQKQIECFLIKEYFGLKGAFVVF